MKITAKELSAPFPRDPRIDFWRAVALVSIFINHIPGSIYGNLTPRNFGWSDAAEIFVFLAGFAAALPYFPKFLAGGALVQSYRAIRRAGQIYLAHIVTIVAVLALFAAAAISFQEPELATRNPLAPSMFLDNPVAGMVGVAILSQHFGFLDDPAAICGADGDFAGTDGAGADRSPACARRLDFALSRHAISRLDAAQLSDRLRLV